MNKYKRAKRADMKLRRTRNEIRIDCLDQTKELAAKYGVEVEE